MKTTIASVHGEALPSTRQATPRSKHPNGARGVSQRDRVRPAGQRLVFGTNHRTPGSPRYILVADRDEDLVESLRDFIQGGFDLPRVELRAATSAREALELVRENRFDLILSDYDMHPGEANEFRILARTRAAGVRFVFFSALGVSRDLAGTDQLDTVVLPKPFDPYVLQDLLLSVIVGSPAQSLSSIRG